MSEKPKKRKVIKLAMLGDTEVGKTAICNSLLGIEFLDNNLSTIGRDKVELKWKIKKDREDEKGKEGELAKAQKVAKKFEKDEEIKLIILDTAGQERFRSIALNTMRLAHGIIVTFDVAARKTFENVTYWLGKIKDTFNDDICIVLFGNKCDLKESTWEVKREEAKKFAESKGLMYFETSAKENKGITKGFEYIVNAAYEQEEKSEKRKGLKLNKKKKKKLFGCC